VVRQATTRASGGFRGWRNPMFKVTVDTENPSIVGHVVNINTFLSAETAINWTPEEAEKRIPTYKKELVDLHGYSDQIISQLLFSVVAIDAQPSEFNHEVIK
jgi:hypothetical protein